MFTLISSSDRKATRGLHAYAANTGRRHPSQIGDGVAKDKRAAATLELVDVNSEELWSGNIIDMNCPLCTDDLATIHRKGFYWQSSYHCRHRL